MQTLYLGVYYPIYWNTAYLIVNSGALDKQEDDDGDKQDGTDYKKVAKAIGQIKAAGIKISLADIS